jgi:hypothetical protein
MANISIRQVLVILGCVAVLFGLLWLPVIGDRLTASVTRVAPKVAPRMVLVGLVILVAGLVSQVGALDIVGAGIIGIVAAAWIFDNY